MGLGNLFGRIGSGVGRMLGRSAPAAERVVENGADDLARAAASRGARGAEESSEAFVRSETLVDRHGQPLLVPASRPAATTAAPAAGAGPVLGQRGFMLDLFAGAARHSGLSTLVTNFPRSTLAATLGVLGFVWVPDGNQDTRGGFINGNIANLIGSQGWAPLPFLDNSSYRAGLRDYQRATAENQQLQIQADVNTAVRTLRDGGPEADAIYTRVAERTGIPLSYLMASDPETRLRAAQIFNVGSPDNETLAVRRLLAGGQENGENMTMAQFVQSQTAAITATGTAANADVNRRAREGLGRLGQGGPGFPGP